MVAVLLHHIYCFVGGVLEIFSGTTVPECASEKAMVIIESPIAEPLQLLDHFDGFCTDSGSMMGEQFSLIYVFKDHFQLNKLFKCPLRVTFCASSVAATLKKYSSSSINVVASPTSICSRVYNLK
mmetsp:Transcript_1947/g.3098  ORF Transcript_1947/g.3098 Transcript_1947/m.3098 type:complete len:125 (-) Transcript_1947:13-387(-)